MKKTSLRRTSNYWIALGEETRVYRGTRGSGRLTFTDDFLSKKVVNEIENSLSDRILAPAKCSTRHEASLCPHLRPVPSSFTATTVSFIIFALRWLKPYGSIQMYLVKCTLNSCRNAILEPAFTLDQNVYKEFVMKHDIRACIYHSSKTKAGCWSWHTRINKLPGKKRSLTLHINSALRKLLIIHTVGKHGLHGIPEK